jgi:hypothetical protein
MRDHRIGLDLVTDVLDVLDRHGFPRGDDQHAGRAIFLIGDLARIYEGTQDHPVGPSIHQPPTPPPSEPPGPDSRDAIIVPASELKTVLIALDIAVDHMRDRARMCTDCPGQTRAAYQTSLQDAAAYGQLVGRILQASAAMDAHPSQTGPPRPGPQPRAADGEEVGQ